MLNPGQRANLLGMFAGSKLMPSTPTDKPESESLSFVEDPPDLNVTYLPFESLKEGLPRELCNKKWRRSFTSPEITLVNQVNDKHKSRSVVIPKRSPSQVHHLTTKNQAFLFDSGEYLSTAPSRIEERRRADMWPEAER